MSAPSYKSFNGQRLLLILLFNIGLLVQISFCQEQIKLRKNSFFIEGLGLGPYYSLNYSRQIFKKDTYQFFGRVGLSSYHFRDFRNDVNPDVILPIGIHFLYGQQHQAEFGLGNTFTSLVKSSDTTFSPERSLEYSGYFWLGYRFRKKGSPYFFGVAYSPLFERYQNFRHWAAVIIGRHF